MKEASLPKICRVDNNPQAEITRVTNAVLLVSCVTKHQAMLFSFFICHMEINIS